MALPRTISGWSSDQVYDTCAYIRADGVYVIGANTGGSTLKLSVWKSANPDTTAFSVLDSANEPTLYTTTTAFGFISTFVAGDILHIACAAHTPPATGYSVALAYYRFDLANDQWLTSHGAYGTILSTYAGDSDPIAGNCSIAVHTTGGSETIQISYDHGTSSYHGTEYNRVMVATYISSWTVGRVFDYSGTTPQADYQRCGILVKAVGVERIHGTVARPSVTLYLNTISTTNTIANGNIADSTGAPETWGDGKSYNDGTTRIYFFYYQNKLVRYFDDAAAPSSWSSAVPLDSPTSTYCRLFALDGSDKYFVFEDDSGSPNELWYDLNFGTDVYVRDFSAAVSGSIYGGDAGNYGNGTTIPMLYYLLGTGAVYDELQLEFLGEVSKPASVNILGSSEVQEAASVQLESPYLWEERWETTTGNGWDENWDGVLVTGTGSLDANYLTSSVTGAPSGWGDRCLEIDYQASSDAAYIEYSNVDTDWNVVYGSFEVIVAAHSAAVSQWNEVVEYGHSIPGIPWLYVRIGQNPMELLFYIKTDGTNFDLYSYGGISTDTPYKVCVYWNNVDDEWAIYVDGQQLAGGSLTGNSALWRLDHMRVGDTSALRAATYYVDNVFITTIPPYTLSTSTPGEVSESASTLISVPSEVPETGSVFVSLPGESADSASARIALRSENAETASVLISKLSQIVEAASVLIEAIAPGEVSDAASALIALLSESQDSASARIALRGETADDASILVALAGEFNEAASVLLSLASQTSSAASARIALLAQQIEAASVLIQQTSETTDAASARIALRSSMANASSALIEVLSETAAAASADIALWSEAADAASALIALRGEIAHAASARIKRLSEVAYAASVLISGTVASQIYELASILVSVIGQTADTASVLIALRSETAKAASTLLALRGETSDVASLIAALRSETSDAASTLISLLSQRTNVASVRVSSNSQAQAIASALISLLSQTTSTASLRAALRSETSSLASIRFALNGLAFELASIRLRPGGIQVANPDADANVSGAWKNELGGTSNLFLSLDEIRLDVSDYIWVDR